MSGGILIDVDACKGWADSGQKAQTPTAVRAQCPFCGDWCGFVLAGKHFNSAARVASAMASCPSCEGRPQFIFAYAGGKNALADSKPTSIYMFPAHAKSYQIRSGQLAVPDPLWRSMEGTVIAYNSRNYTATMSSGRRTLEGIFKYMVPAKDRNLTLFKLIKKVETEVDLAAPLKRLSDAIRTGGNLGAHFDMEHEPDETMARQLVELLDYLIEYLYSLPSQIEALENAIDPPGKKSGEQPINN